MLSTVNVFATFIFGYRANKNISDFFSDDHCLAKFLGAQKFRTEIRSGFCTRRCIDRRISTIEINGEGDKEYSESREQQSGLRDVYAERQKATPGSRAEAAIEGTRMKRGAKHLCAGSRAA
jgi:hypothetical protein